MDFDAIIKWVVPNLPFIIVVVIFIGISIRAMRDGFISELFSFICAVIATVAILFLAIAVRGVFSNKRLEIVVALVLLILLGIVDKLLNLIFDPIRLIAKLPVIKVVDKLAGIAMAAFETIVIVWAVYCVIIVSRAGAFGDWVMDCVRVNPLMELMFENNYIFIWGSKLTDKINLIEMMERLNL